METPEALLKGIEGEREQAAVVAKFRVLKEVELGFTDFTMMRIARGELYERNKRGEAIPLSFTRAIAKARVGIYGDTRGLDHAEIEVVAEGLGVSELIYETELERPE